MKDKIADLIIDNLSDSTLKKLSDRELSNIINSAVKIYKQGVTDTVNQAELLLDKHFQNENQKNY